MKRVVYFRRKIVDLAISNDSITFFDLVTELGYRSSDANLILGQMEMDGYLSSGSAMKEYMPAVYVPTIDGNARKISGAHFATAFKATKKGLSVPIGEEPTSLCSQELFSWKGMHSK
jgi:hypothetical protein